MIRIQARSSFVVAALALSLAGLGCSEKLLGISPSITVTPTALAFGQGMVGTRQEIRVSVSNVGSAPLEIGSIKVSSDPNNELALFELLATDCDDQARTGSTQLAPGECARFSVTWTPNAVHPAAGAVEIDSNDAQQPSITLPVTGDAVAPVLQYCVLAADGSVDPAACSDLGATPPVEPALDFGTGTIGTAVARKIRVTNQGQAPLVFAPGPSLSPSGSTDFALTGSVPGDQLAAGASADLTITATPSATGTLSSALLLSSDDQFEPQLSVPIQIEVAAFPIISVTPSVLAFGSSTIGTPQQIRVSVSNIGTAPLVLSSVKVATDPNSELSIDDLLTTDCMDVSRSAGSTLQPGECARFTVVWSPLAVHAASGSVEIDSNDPTTPVVTLPVSGDAVSPLLQVCVLTSSGTVDPTQCSNLAVTPHTVPTIDFGSSIPGAATALTVRLTNQGSAPLVFSPAPALSAATPAAFALSGAVAGNSIAAGAFSDLTLTATPTTNGTLTGALNLASNDPRAPTLAVPIQLTVPGWALCITPTAGLNFGTVTVGQSQVLTLTFTNCGSAEFTVNSFAYAATAPTTTQFALTSGALPAANSTLAVGASVALGYTYKPTVVQSDAAKVSYSLSVGSAMVSGSVPIVGVGSVPACGSSGKPNPVANVVTSYATAQSGAYTVFNPATAPSPVIPLDWVKLDASTSTVSSAPASYVWQLASQPAGSTTTLSSTAGPSVTMQTLVSGTYAVTLVVKDSAGCVSATDTITIQVVPVGAVHIELTWKEDCGDLDLHYVAPGGAMCDGNDIFYADLPEYTGGASEFPDWGCATGQSCNGAPSDPGGDHPDKTTTDDGTLDVDNVVGYGPENITQKAPFDSPSGTPYQVWVFYFSDHGDCPTAHPTVNIYINGVLNKTYVLTNGFTNHQLWHPANIAVSSGRTVFTVSAGSSTLTTDNGTCGYETPD